MKVAVVVPTIREDSIQRFMTEWSASFAKHKVTLVIVEDNPKKTFTFSTPNTGVKVLHLSWADIEKDLGKNAWIIPRRTSAIKAYGFYRASKLKPDMILSLDDDCYPLENYIKGFNAEDCIAGHAKALFTESVAETAWFSTIKMKGKVRPRGLPYTNTTRTVSPEHVMISHGLWANVPDFDATTQLSVKKIPLIGEYFLEGLVPKGQYFPLCGMNFAWKPECTPALFFMLMGKDAQENPWGFDRFDDIWGGIFAKKICDHLGYRIKSGYPVIWHARASDPQKNLIKEKTGVVVNEELWHAVDAIVLTKKTFKDCYKELAQKLQMDGPYWAQQKRAMKLWADLF